MKITKKLFAAFMSAMLFISLIPSMALADAPPVAKSTIEAKIKKLCADLSLGETKESIRWYWNSDITDMNTLKNGINNYINKGDISYIKAHLKENEPCAGRKGENSNTHSFQVKVSGKDGCDSNEFSGRRQCFGFATYIEYYLFGAADNDSSGYFTTFTLQKGTDLQIGDHIRKSGHSFIYCGTNSKNELIALQANGYSSSKPCGLTYGRVYYDKYSYYNTTNVVGATVYRYKNVTACAHDTINFVRDDYVPCASCNYNFAYPAVSGGGAYMDVIAVNSSGTAPSHVTPYGSATIKDRYKKGDTVYVVGSAKNGYKNLWYKLSNGDWLSGDYLGAHKHTKVDGFCTRCVDSLDIIELNNFTIEAKKSGKFPVHFAPYGASPKFYRSGSVKVSGKAINVYKNIWYRLSDGGWVFVDYLRPAQQSGIVKISGDTLSLNNKAAASGTNGSKKIAELSNNTPLTIYPGEKVNKWYSVRTGNKVGYAHSNWITVTDATKAIEAYPTHTEPGLSVSDLEDFITPAPVTPTPAPVTPTPAPSGNAASVLYPTDSTYLSKFSVSETNAVVVANIRKNAGAKVTVCGLMLYDANGNLIKDHRENISNVSVANTNFHAWYDINGELHLTLSAGTTYKYRFYTIIDGTTYYGETYSFTTTPSQKPVEEEKKQEPVKEQQPEKEQEQKKEDVYYNLIFDPNGGTCSISYKSIKFDSLIGEMPVPTRSGHTFTGWYSAPQGGNLIHENVRYNAPFDVSVYAHWEKRARILTMWIGKSEFEANGKKTAIDAEGTVPIIINGRTLVPIRAIAEAMGGTVEWNENERSVTITLGEHTVRLLVYKPFAEVDGKYKALDVAPEIIGGRTMVPVRFVAENLNVDVLWDGDDYRITMTY